MKFLVIGLGSMGKRRIRNLQHMKAGEIIGFDVRDDRRKEAEKKYKIKTFGTFEDALSQNPDVFIISTPPKLHLKYELEAAKRNKHFFCETGIFRDRLEELIGICKDKNIIAAPSCTLRFKDSIKKIKELIDANRIGKVVALAYHVGQYLPDWHPWEKMTDFYAGQKETSATRELAPFELGWLTWIFGDINRLSCIKGKISSLEADIDDVYQLIMQFKSGIIGNVLIEVVSRTPVRVLRIVGEEGTIEWDWSTDTVRLYDAKTKKWTEFKEKKGFREKGYLAKESMYVEEMKDFLNAIKGKGRYNYTLEAYKKILDILHSAERSS